MAPADRFVSQQILPGRFLKIRRLSDAADGYFGDTGSELGFATGPSDILPTVYEGGLRVWEGTKDLVRCLEAAKASGAVLDLGCGSGIAGIFCLLSDCDRVDFHDFNEPVIKYFTLANVQENCPDLLGRCSFYSGDWADFDVPYQYDLIVTSETIYNPSSYPKIARILHRFLRVGTGFCLLAAKNYYFGCGGSILDFCQYLRERYESSFVCTSVWKTAEGVPRQVVRIERV